MKRSGAGACLLATALGLCVAADARADFQGATHLMPFDEDTIHYSKSPATGPVARLQEQLDRGTTQLRRDATHGFLLSLLRELRVSTNSQMLVFSQTSFQRDRISPAHPRAVFFNDTVYVGYVPGSPLLEISTADPKLGAVFYTLDQTPVEKPRFVRNDQCLECHASAKTMGVPGHLVRSFATDERGVVDLNTGTSLVNHRTPLTERWGGWYVTGTHGRQLHRGNLIGPADFLRQEREPNFRGNLVELGRFITTTNYPTAHSDLVALMVLEHQTHLHNFITRLNYEATLALQQYGHVNYLKSITDAFLKYLLFTEETPLTEPIRGTAPFTAEFTAAGPKDAQGRSLRELDLQTRLFKYPCSYLIYSDAFAALPPLLKEHLYQQLFDILTGKDARPEWASLAPGTRQAIREILVATKPDLPEYWKHPQTADARR